MSIIGSQSLSVERVPNVGVVILGATEEQITLSVVFYLSDRSLMPMHHDRLHVEGKFLRVSARKNPSNQAIVLINLRAHKTISDTSIAKDKRLSFTSFVPSIFPDELVFDEK